MHAERGHVLRWDNDSDGMLVAFAEVPKASSKVIGYLSTFGGQTTAIGALPIPDGVPSVATLTVEELAKNFDKYNSKVVTLTGKFIKETGGDVDLEHSDGLGASVYPPSGQRKFAWQPPPAGTVVTFVGFVTGSDKLIVLKDAKVSPQVPMPGMPPLDPSGALTAEDLAGKAADHAGKAVTVSGTVRAAVNEADGSGLVEFETASGKKAVRATVEPAKWKRGEVKTGDQFTAKGIVSVEPDCVLVVTGAPKPGGTTPLGKPLATLTADGLADEIVVYNAQLIQVSGTAAAVADIPGGGGSVDFKMTGKRMTVRVLFEAANWKSGTIKAGDRVEAKGKTGYGKGNVIELTKCELVKHEGGTAPKADAEALTVAQVIDGYDTLKGKVVTMQGKVAFREENTGRARGVVAFELVKGAKMSVRAVLEKGNWRTNFLADDDTLTVKGKVTNEPLGPDGAGGKMIVLEDCELVKRTTKDGKDVPIPAKVDPKPGDAIEVTADDLLAEYIKDSTAADTKYKGKEVKITGAVQSITPQSVVLGDKSDGETSFKISVGFPAQNG
jgi:tRNA_anti-like